MFLCPISHELMSDLVLVLESGQTYERTEISQWFQLGNRSDPITYARLSSTLLVPNYALRAGIADWA
jgi:hypothetical protein